MATRWGLCHVGKISHDFSVDMKTLPPGDHQIVVVAARSLERAREFAKKHSIPKAYGSYEELASDAEIDMVYLDVLHTEHWRLGLLVLQAGKNMLCEKPFAMNSREVGDLIAASKKSNVFLIGVYNLQFVLMVFNGERPESIHATGVLLNSGMDEPMVVMKFPRNRLAFCFFSIAVSLPNNATISGTTGTIRATLLPHEEMARDPEIEVVYVGTTQPYHLPVGMLFMKAQKNVLCEKSMAMNLRGV
ncbi:trans-1,2-dihydrobenzene-1,2-diol dehydrogenase-like [Oncorhynchus tshawytscha]|uniref:trans-1,2-dihydrobenzene-1,2-diol dehydrogenase-like n=1 Tax=Oncorhynchus tshawytscha TaxID=74940 RepID=UPI000D0A09B3|nr:trans-1,2-dihydrobenzene-1,2-diol dehydrogenase-like [Oncorhynchus tshawytscha]